MTDANVVLSRIPSDEPLGADVPIDPERALAAVSGLAHALDLDPTACAEGIIRIAVEEMVRALRRVSVERGVDPREATLVSFGGAGPLHACDVADAIGARRILVPPAAGTLAALGLVQAGARRDWVQTVLRRIGPDTDLSEDLESLRTTASSALPGGHVDFEADCRYVGQSHALTVALAPDEPLDELEGRFHAAHERQYGAAARGEPIEIVSLRVSSQEAGATVDLAGTRDDLRAGGPAVLRVDAATLWIAPGWRSRPGPARSAILERRS